MSTDVERVLRAIASSPAPTRGQYVALDVGSRSRHAHFARTVDGSLALLVPLHGAESVVARVSRGVKLRAVAEVEFLAQTRNWVGPAAIIESHDVALSKTFAALAVSMATRIDAWVAPTWELLVELMGEWEQLLARRQRLGQEAQIGLWGELRLVAAAHDPAMLLDAWRGPERGHVDFFTAGVGLEVKASRSRGFHFVSQAQVDAPFGDADSYIVSMHLMPDPVSGVSLAELVHTASTAAANPGEFEEKLARTGYSRDDEDAYSTRWALLPPVSVYAAADVPRVRAADPGISQLRFRVDFTSIRPLEATASTALLSTLGLARLRGETCA